MHVSASKSLITRIHHVTLPFSQALLLQQGCQCCRHMLTHARVVADFENKQKYINNKDNAIKFEFEKVIIVFLVIY